MWVADSAVKENPGMCLYGSPASDSQRALAARARLGFLLLLFVLQFDDQLDLRKTNMTAGRPFSFARNFKIHGYQ